MAEYILTDTDFFVVLKNGLDHGNLAGLSDDDHTQYFLVDGTREITGVLGMLNTQGHIYVDPASDAQTLIDIYVGTTCSTNRASLRIFRQTNTSGVRSVEFFKGDGSTTFAGYINLATGTWFIGNDSSNAKMTTGLTINQGANDDEILALKSSDVAHGMTDEAETDTFMSIKKNEAVGGGIDILTLKDTDGTVGGSSLRVIAMLGDNADTAKTSSGRAISEFWCNQISGTSHGNVVASGNLFCIRGRISNGWGTKWICDIDGDTWQAGTLCLNSDKDAYTSAHGIVLDLAGDDDLCALQMRDSTDVAHGMTSWCSTNTWGVIRKALAAGGGIKIEGYTDGDSNYPVYIQAFSGQALNAVKTVNALGAVNIVVGEISGTGLSGSITADANLFTIRKAVSGPTYTTVFAIDEDGDIQCGRDITFMSGTDNTRIWKDVDTSGFNFVAGTTGDNACSIQMYGRDHASWPGKMWLTVGGYDDLGWIRFRHVATGGVYKTLGGFNPGGIFFIGATEAQTNAKQTIGLTINQGANDDEAISLKSSDVAHGFTANTETDTWLNIVKLSGPYGGAQIRAYAEDNASANASLSLLGYGGTPDTTKSVSGGSLITIWAGEISGGAISDLTADGNIVGMGCRRGSAWEKVWILDEDGDVWQDGYLGLNCIKSGFESPIGLYMDVAGNDSPCLTLRDSTDIDHGMTSYTDTETWGDFTKASATSGGLRIRGFTETNQQAFKLLGFVGSAADTTKSSAGRSACEIICGQISGTTVGAYGADSNVFSVRKQETGPVETTLWILDEDGDTWQSGYLTLESSGAVGIVIFAGESQAANIVAKNDAQIWGFGCASSDEWFVYDSTNSTYGIHILPNPLHKLLLQTTYTALADGATNKHYWTNNIYFIQDSANSAMEYGITINAPATTAEIFALKDSTNVAHGLTGVTETDTFFTLQKAVVGSGGIRMEAVAEDAAIQGVFTLDSYGGTADTTKTTSGLGLVSVNVYEINSGAVADITADGNIFAIRAQISGSLISRLLLDEDGDLWISGDMSIINGRQLRFEYNTTRTYDGIITHTHSSPYDSMEYYATAGAGGWIGRHDFYAESSGGGDNLILRLTEEGNTQPLQPAFDFTPTASQSGIAIDQYVDYTFDSERFDQNDDFNAGTYTFTAPVSGRYQLNAVLRLQDIDTGATYYFFELVCSNQTYRHYITPATTIASDGTFPITFAAVADMDENDTAKVRVYQAGGAAQHDLIAASSSFSGALIC